MAGTAPKVLLQTKSDDGKSHLSWDEKQKDRFKREKSNSERMEEWINECMNEQINDLRNESINEWLYVWINE